MPRIRKKVEERTDELKRKNIELKELAMKDGLTQLFNHSTTAQALSAEINRAQRYESSLCICMMDIDFFKKVNDEYGHKKGDFVLQEFSTILKNESRETDVLGRYGGEEFLILLTNTDLEDAVITCERIRKKVEMHNFDGIHITVSGGISKYSNKSIDDFITDADNNLYKAKNEGRNRIVYNELQKSVLA